MSMRSPDDRLFIQIRSAYHDAKARSNYSDIGRITRLNFNWLIEYMERKLSANLSRKFRTVKKWKAVCDFLRERADGYTSTSAARRDLLHAERMIKDIIYVLDPPPSRETL